MTDSDARLELLREPFPADAVGKIPKNIGDGPKSECRVCGGFHARAGLHLDYVGHAGVTDRLLSVDPCWTWEPFALDDRGLPALIRDKDGWERGLWIKLTVCGVTRPGYGTCDKGKSDAIKELIGDALRNAAMRFGVALDLWAKDGLESVIEPLAAQFDDRKEGDDKNGVGALDDAEPQSGNAAGGDGNGSSQPALTPGFSGDPL